MITDLETQSVGCETLAERLLKGSLSAEQFVRYATQLGQALRDLHDSGRSHGSVSPRTLLLTADGVALIPPAETATAAGVPGDIFDFGTVLGEMLSRLSDNETDDHGMGPLVASCLASDPAQRPPSMQKVLLELKVAGLAARRSSARASSRPDFDAALRTEIQRAETRQEFRMKEAESIMSEQLKMAGCAMSSMRTELDAMQVRLAQVEGNTEGTLSRVGELDHCVGGAIRQLEARLTEAVTRIEQDLGTQASILDAVRRSMTQTDDLIGRVVENFESKLEAAHAAADDNASRLDIVERGLRATSDQSAKAETRLADSLRRLQAEVETRAAVVESVRKSMAQTDHLVGRVVEAVETILDVNASRS